MTNYWEKRFQDEGKIWGDLPSNTAGHAFELFQKKGVKSVLIPGSGYGRNTKLFSHANFSVVGIEISKRAIALAKEFDPLTIYYQGSVLDMPFSSDLFDGIYCFNVLHLFLERERRIFVEKCYNQLKPRGYAFFVAFSVEEESYGKGKEIEENTFESKPGRPVHYFSKNDLIRHFYDFLIIETGSVQEAENHGEIGPHVHKLRYIFAQKM